MSAIGLGIVAGVCLSGLIAFHVRVSFLRARYEGWRAGFRACNEVTCSHYHPAGCDCTERYLHDETCGRR